MKKQNFNTTKQSHNYEPVLAPGQNQNPLPKIDIYQKLMELLSIQYEVNYKLLINAKLTQNYIKQIDESNGKTSSSEGSTLVSGKQKNVTDKNEKRPLEIKTQQKLKNIKIIPKKKQRKEQSDYEPSDDQQVLVQYKLSESKNVPKNYGKAILAFVKKNQAYVKKVLLKFELKFSDFKIFISKFKNNINTIQELRFLWIDIPENPYSTALRIISAEYLRKHCLAHIFNSRVENYGKHVKYRHKILQAIERPQQFTQMKDF